MRFISRLDFVEVQSIEPQGMCATFGKKGLLTTCMEWFTTYLLKVASARHHLGTVRSMGVCITWEQSDPWASATVRSTGVRIFGR